MRSGSTKACPDPQNDPIRSTRTPWQGQPKRASLGTLAGSNLAHRTKKKKGTHGNSQITELQKQTCYPMRSDFTKACPGPRKTTPPQPRAPWQSQPKRASLGTLAGAQRGVQNEEKKGTHGNSQITESQNQRCYPMPGGSTKACPGPAKRPLPQH